MMLNLFRLLSNRCMDIDELLSQMHSKYGFSSLFKSNFYDLFSLNYINEQLGSS